MNKPLDLPDVTLKWDAHLNGLIVTHKKTGMFTTMSAERLNAWLLRQLRTELVSSRDRT